MIPPHVYDQLVIVGLLWRCVMLHSVWPSRGAVSPPPPNQPLPPQVKRQRSNKPTPFGGLTQQPHGAPGEPDANQPEPQLPRRPAPLAPTHRRPRAVDTSMPC